MTNKDRADRAQLAMTAYIGEDSMTHAEAVRDLLCDLKHWCDQNNVDFIDEAYQASRCQAEEVADEHM